MKAYGATITINASPKTIWAILTDAAGYPEWDPGMVRLEGHIAPGEKITAYTKVSPDRAFPVTVTEFVPDEKMIWTGGMPLGLFKGERSFTLTPQSGGATEVNVREEFTGLLLPIFGRSIPDLTSIFEQFAAGLTGQAEKSSA